MNFEDELKKIDLDKLIDRMTAYTIKRLKSVGSKNLQGSEPIDFVSEVLTKAMTGVRDWNKSSSSLTDFLFGCLRSDLSAFFKKYKAKKAADEIIDANSIEEIYVVDDEVRFSKDLELTDHKNKAIELLKGLQADTDELNLFELWSEGSFTPKETAEILNKTPTEINNTAKRLERKLEKVRPTLISIKYE